MHLSTSLPLQPRPIPRQPQLTFSARPSISSESLTFGQTSPKRKGARTESALAWITQFSLPDNIDLGRWMSMVRRRPILLLPAAALLPIVGILVNGDNHPAKDGAPTEHSAQPVCPSVQAFPGDPKEVFMHYIMSAEAGNTVDTGGLTKTGIASDWNPQVNDENFTAADAEAIYRDEIWPASGAKVSDPALAVLHADTAVNHGPKEADFLLEQSKGDFDDYIGLRITSLKGIELPGSKYTSPQANWPRYGKGWLKRLFELHKAVGKIPEDATVLPLYYFDLQGGERVKVPMLLYEIQPGDSLSLIADKFNVKPGAIQALNAINDPSKIAAGTMLQVPLTQYTVGEKDPHTLTGLADKFEISPKRLVKINGGEILPEQLKTGGILIVPGGDGVLDEGEFPPLLPDKEIPPCKPLVIQPAGPSESSRGTVDLTPDNIETYKCDLNPPLADPAKFVPVHQESTNNPKTSRPELYKADGGFFELFPVYGPVGEEGDVCSGRKSGSHTAIDALALRGHLIVSPAHAVVYNVIEDNADAGRTTDLYLGKYDGKLLFARFFHNNEFKVKKGDKVEPYDIIATIGDTGFHNHPEKVASYRLPERFILPSDDPKENDTEGTRTHTHIEFILVDDPSQYGKPIADMPDKSKQRVNPWMFFPIPDYREESTLKYSPNGNTP